ncbi:MAG: hypothetical protein IH892_06855 [Planctomycetes bacterium]|nr:hypothetical protein [Planctomycetota bacterium]
MSKQLFIIALAIGLVMGHLAWAKTPLDQDAGPDGIVSVEAEHFDENVPDGAHFWELNTDIDGFSGDGFMRALPDIGANDGTVIGGDARLDFQVNFVKTGIHYVWVRSYRTSNFDDSVHVGLDEVETTSESIQTGDTSISDTWQWSNERRSSQGRAQVDVTSLGVHILHARMREDGMRFDKIVLTTNPDFTPADLGPEESSRGDKTKARGPSPSNDGSDVPWYLNELNWEAGEFATTHNVYFGKSFDDVQDRAAAALLAEGLTETSQAIQTDLETTYYWAVDEVNGAPDFSVNSGNVWSFTVESVANLITNVTATADSQFSAEHGPENTVNGSGLIDGLHNSRAEDMWQSNAIPATIEFQFARVYVLHEMRVWNHNQSIETFLGFGAKDVTVEVSANGTDFAALEGVGPFTQAPAAGGYAANTTVAFNGIAAKAVRLTITSNFGGVFPNTGLSEVQFSAIPVFAREPQPADGASGVGVDATLGWRSGRHVDRHDLHLGTDPNDLPLVGSVSENAFNVRDLDLPLGQTHYWRVDEVNDATDPSIRVGDVWMFMTADAIVIDDMESYRDDEFREIWATWIDGFEDAANNGALVGADPSAGDYAPETNIVRGGSRSLPIWFDNSAAPISEATRTFAEAQDWTRSGVTTLVLYFQGDLTDLSGRLYVKINDQKVVYMLAPDAIVPPAWLVWNRWSIDLSALPGLTNVKTLIIGVEGAGVQGVLYVDDIQLVAAVASSSRVVGWFEAESADSLTAPLEIMDESTASGGKYIGTLNGVGNSNNAPPPDGIATYTLTVAGGTYKLTGRIDTEGGNSFWVRILGAQTPPDTELHASGWVRWNDPPPLDGWNWIDIFSDDDDQDATVLFTMDPGTYTLEIARREDGARLDAIALVQID